MLFYIKCPSCSRFISMNLDKYLNDLNNIRNTPGVSKEERETRSSELLNTYKFKKECCRIRILGMVPFHEIIVT